MKLAKFGTGITLLAASLLSAVAYAQPQHALSMFGDARYDKNFTHFEYVNPDAPKGGKVTLSEMGGFDSFNPYTAKDEAPGSIGLTIATLMTSSDDEPFTEYPYLARSVEKLDGNKGIVFNLNPQARFHDGSEITADDVIATFNYLRTQGKPFYAAYYRDVDTADAVNKHTVRFNFKHGDNRELPLILGQLPVLKAADLPAPGADREKIPFVGSGPYRVTDYKFGQHVVYERVRDYWGSELPAMKGRYNFDEIRVDNYRDENVVLEAFKSGRIDYNFETSAKRWATAYTGDKFDNGTIRKAEIPHRNPAGMQAFAFNSRRTLFNDPRVRRAIAYAYDFEWANNNLFHGAYTRSNSYFANSDCAATGVPQGAELQLLEAHRKQLPEKLFSEPYLVPKTSGDGNIRPNLREAVKLLGEAGWKIRNNALVNEAGQPFVFDLMLYSQDFQRVALPFKANLQKLGITMNVRLVDSSQYIKSLRAFDFDMIIHSVPQSVSPGNEQRDFWHSSLASQEGSRNVMGINNPVVDQLIDVLVSADTREEQIAACKAMDRVLLWNDYVIPQWYISVYRVAYWDKFGMPEKTPVYNDFGFYNWWIKPEAQ